MFRNKKSVHVGKRERFLKSSRGAWGCPKEGQTKLPQEYSFSGVILAVKEAGVKELRWRLRLCSYHHFQRQLGIAGCFASHISIGDQVSRYTLRNQIAFAF
jgi:hypothetical protein